MAFAPEIPKLTCDCKCECVHVTTVGHGQSASASEIARGGGGGTGHPIPSVGVSEFDLVARETRTGMESLQPSSLVLAAPDELLARSLRTYAQEHPLRVNDRTDLAEIRLLPEAQWLGATPTRLRRTPLHAAAGELPTRQTRPPLFGDRPGLNTAPHVPTHVASPGELGQHAGALPVRGSGSSGADAHSSQLLVPPGSGLKNVRR